MQTLSTISSETEKSYGVPLGFAPPGHMYQQPCNFMEKSLQQTSIGPEVPCPANRLSSGDTSEGKCLPTYSNRNYENAPNNEKNLVGNNEPTNQNENGNTMRNNINFTALTPTATGTNYCNKSENLSNDNAYTLLTNDLITSREETATVNSKETNNNIKSIKDKSVTNFFDGSAELRTVENDEDDVLGPLPLKWETAYTERGELYFIDHNTGTSHWLDPRLSKFQKKSLEDCGDNELPYGWEKIEDALYGTYFIDHVNRRTQYENPVLEAKRRVAERQKIENQQMSSSKNDDGGSAIVKDKSNKETFDNAKRNCLEDSLKPVFPYKFTRNPSEMLGKKIITTLLKSSRGLGITIVGGDDSTEEFLQIKSIVPNGPAWLDGKLRTGDILVYVNDTCILGFTHHEMVNVFQSILPGETVTLEVCRGYPLPFDPNDPNTEVVTTIAVDGISTDPEKPGILINFNRSFNFLDTCNSVGNGGSNATDDIVVRTRKNSVSPVLKFQPNNESQVKSYSETYDEDFVQLKKPEVLSLSINKGVMGFGFTIADSSHGQKVKKILDRKCCKNLKEGDILLEVNNLNVRSMSHCDVVQLLKDCSKPEPTTVKIQRGYYYHSTGNVASVNSVRVDGNSDFADSKIKETIGTPSGLFRSKTPTADLYRTQQKEILPIRPKTPVVDTRRARVKTPCNDLNEEVKAVTNCLENRNISASEEAKLILADTKSTNSLQEIDFANNEIPFMDPFPKLVTSLSERLAEASIINENKHSSYKPSMEFNRVRSEHCRVGNDENQEYISGYNSVYGNPNTNNASEIFSPLTSVVASSYNQEACYCFECQEYQRHKFHQQQQSFQQRQYQQNYSSNYFQHQPQQLQARAHVQNSRIQKRANELTNNHRKNGVFNSLENNHLKTNLLQGSDASPPQMWNYVMQSAGGLAASFGRLNDEECELAEVTLERQAVGFGFRIVGGTEEGSQVTVGHIVPGGAADADPNITTGDEILSIDSVNVVNSSHHKVVSLMGEAALRGHVTMILRRRAQHLRKVTVPTFQFPYDVIVSRQDHEGFGFVIISSSNQYYGSTIGKLIPSSPADRCGELKVGDRIIAVNRIAIAGMSHGEIVNLIKESGLHVRLTIGCPKDGNPMVNAFQSSPVIGSQQEHSPRQENSQGPLKSLASSYFDRSDMTQHPQL